MFYDEIEENLILALNRISLDRQIGSKCIDQIGICGTIHPELSSDRIEHITKELDEFNAELKQIAADNRRRDDRILSRSTAKKIKRVLRNQMLSEIRHTRTGVVSHG